MQVNYGDTDTTNTAQKQLTSFMMIMAIVKLNQKNGLIPAGSKSVI